MKNKTMESKYLKKVLKNLDAEHRKFLINFFNERVFYKYLPLKSKVSDDIWRKLIMADPYFLDPKFWAQAEEKGMDKDWKQIYSTELDKDLCIGLVKNWVESDCSYGSFFDGQTEEILFDTEKYNGDLANRSRLFDKKYISDLLDRGLIILSVMGDDYYIIFYKLKNNRYQVVTTIDLVEDNAV